MLKQVDKALVKMFLNVEYYCSLFGSIHKTVNLLTDTIGLNIKGKYRIKNNVWPDD